SLAQPSRGEGADTVVQAELALGDELHDDRRHEALRDASDPEPVVGASRSASDLGLPCSDDGALAVLLDERDHSWDVARGDEPVGGALKLALGRRRPSGEEDACDGKSCNRAHVPSTPRAGWVLQRYLQPARGV